MTFMQFIQHMFSLLGASQSKQRCALSVLGRNRGLSTSLWGTLTLIYFPSPDFLSKSSDWKRQYSSNKPDSLESIAGYRFLNHHSLKTRRKVHFSKSLVEIGYNTFQPPCAKTLFNHHLLRLNW